MKLEFYDGTAVAFEMFFAVLDWLRQQPISPGRSFKGIGRFSITPDDPAHPYIIEGRLSNGLRFVCFNQMKGMQLPGMPKQLLQPSQSTFRLYKADGIELEVEGSFIYQQLDSGNKRLVFTPKRRMV